MEKASKTNPNIHDRRTVLFGRRRRPLAYMAHRQTAAISSILFPMTLAPSRISWWRYLVCKMLEEHSGEWQVTVVDLPKLRIVKRFDRIPIDTPVQWYPDETALVYVKDEKGI